MKPIRVLHVVGIMNRGGTENLLMNLYRKIDKSKIQFDFLVHQKMEGVFDQEIESLGGKVYHIDYVTKVGHFKYKKNLLDFFNSHLGYSIVQVHMNAMNGLVLKSAKDAKIPIRISHCHSTKHGSSMLGTLYKKYVAMIIPNVATHFWGCSYEAGKWLYGKKIADDKFMIFKNGIDLNNFVFKINTQSKIRQELNIDSNHFVLGHIGRFQNMKNHDFLIDVFFDINRRKQNSLLLLVGDGDLKSKIEEKVNKLGIEKAVRFLGVRSDVSDILHLIDAFIFPSFYEGFPVTLVEAQAMGVKCIVSNTIVKTVDLGVGLVEFLELKSGANYWANKILQKTNVPPLNNIQYVLSSNGYDINSTAKWLQNFYIECLDSVSN